MSSISNNTNRVAGLMSGLETEELVKAMSANTKARINSKKQKLQSLQWKQESYRSVISKISDFQKKYLDILGEKSIKANAVMKKCVATSSNDKIISATAAAGAAAGKYVIKEATAAKTASISTDKAAAAGSVKLDFSAAKEGKNYDVEINFDGSSRTIVFEGGADAEATKANFLAAANNAISEYKRDDQGFEFKDGSWLVFNGANDDIYHTFSVGKNVEGVGLEKDTSNRITTSSKLGAIGFNQKLQSEGGKYNININGCRFEFNDETTVSEMMNTINKSDAGVKMSFSNVSQSFTFETKDTGAGQEINLYQTGGNLLNAVLNIGSDRLGVSQADSAKIEYVINSSYTEKLSSVVTDKLEGGFEADEDATYALNLNVDGKDYALELDFSSLTKKADGESYTTDQINEAFRLALNKAFNDAGGSVGDIKLTYSGKNLTVESSDHLLKIGANDLTLEEGKTNEKLVTGDEMYVLAKEPGEFKFKVDGEDFTFSIRGNLTIGSLVDSGLFTLRADGTLVANSNISAGDDFTKELLTKYFGKDTLTPATAGDTLTAYGSNSKLVLSNGGDTFTTYTSASNLFSFDGTTINLTDAKDFKADTEEDYITVDTARDTSTIKDLVKEFVNDYNKLLDDLYGETSTARPKSKNKYFDPLTEEQEEEMEEKEIEKWNENAKKGLLYLDSNVQKFLSEIRSAMSTYKDGFGLSTMGVTLTKDWEDNGKLEIDESKLESAIEAYGDKIADLFTSENGIAAKLENAVDRAISTKTKKYGYLTSLAGMENTKTATDNYIYKQMQTIQDVIDRLTKKYEDEQERYWSQFTALEKYMAQMQQQQSYFTQE